MPPNPPHNSGESALYRRVWRWHFYAGLICLPFLALMAVTGALYLYNAPIESLVYGSLRNVPVTEAPALDAEAIAARAQAEVPGQVFRYIAPPQPGRTAEVGVRTAEGHMVSVYVDPAGGAVVGQLRDDRKLMDIVKRTHSLMIVGPWANYWVEIVAGWSIVLVVSGVFLWWPRGKAGNALKVRGRPAQRTWWRDMHAVTGVLASGVVVFLAVTGMPWSAYWGLQYGRIANEFGIGLPKYVWAMRPQSSPPMSSVGETPWIMTNVPLPQSGGHAGHGGHGAPPAAVPAGPPLAPSIGLNEALRLFNAELGLPVATPVGLPAGPQGVYTAMYMPDDTRAERVVHLDRYSGTVLADVGYADYGIAGRLSQWGVKIHTGRQFGWFNQLVMLAGCISIVLLAVTSLVRGWKRRPRGRLAAPPRRAGDRAAKGAIAVAVCLGVFYPLLGASMVVALLVDALVPQRWHARFGL